LQKTVDQQLGLYSDVKEQSILIAQVMVMALMSQPVADEIGMHFLFLPDLSCKKVWYMLDCDDSAKQCSNCRELTVRGMPYAKSFVNTKGQMGHFVHIITYVL